MAPRETAMSIVDIATEAAARLNLTRGRDNKWRGRCPACGYDKPTLEVAVEQDRIAVSCNACGDVAGIAAMMGVATRHCYRAECAAIEGCPSPRCLAQRDVQRPGLWSNTTCRAEGSHVHSPPRFASSRGSETGATAGPTPP